MSKLRELDTPIFWAEGHPGPLPRETWEVAIEGLVERPLRLSYAEILARPAQHVFARLTSVSGWTVGGVWDGVRLADLLDEAGVLLPDARYVKFTSYRGVYTTAIPLEVARLERTLLAYGFEGEPLEEDYGGPVRILCPYLWGYKSAKSVVRIELLDRPAPGYWEVRGYPDDAQIKPRRIFDVNTKRWRRIAGGEVIEFVDE